MVESQRLALRFYWCLHSERMQRRNVKIAMGLIPLHGWHSATKIASEIQFNNSRSGKLPLHTHTHTHTSDAKNVLIWRRPTVYEFPFTFDECRARLRVIESTIKNVLSKGADANIASSKFIQTNRVFTAVTRASAVWQMKMKMEEEKITNETQLIHYTTIHNKHTCFIHLRVWSEIINAYIYAEAHSYNSQRFILPLTCCSDYNCITPDRGRSTINTMN